jgi:hypothetical protein
VLSICETKMLPVETSETGGEDLLGFICPTDEGGKILSLFNDSSYCPSSIFNIII